MVTEGSSTNVFAVCSGVIYTHPESNLILSGITRQVILELLSAADFPFKEEAVSLEQLRRAEEIWICSSTAEIVPVISLDGKPVGDGKVGALTREVRQRYRAAVQDCCG